MRVRKSLRQFLNLLILADDKSESALNMSAAILAFVMMWAVMLQITLRLFTVSPPGIYEGIELFLVGTVFFAISYTQKIGAHVRMELLIDRIKGKGRYIIEIIYLALFLLAFAIITWQGAKSTWIAFSTGDTSMSIVPIVTWPARLIVPVGCFFLCIRFIRQIFSYIALIRGKEVPVELTQKKPALSDL
ncbi:TRAP transporter small permease subunit [Chloroflexota bacterium]